MILWPVSFPPGELSRKVLLDDDLAAQAGVLCQIRDTESTAAEDFFDHKFLQPRTCRQGLAGWLGVRFVSWHDSQCGKGGGGGQAERSWPDWIDSHIQQFALEIGQWDRLDFWPELIAFVAAIDDKGLGGFEIIQG